MATTPPKLGPHPYIDEDADGSFLDLPDPRYKGRTAEESAAAVDRLLQPGSKVQLPKLPPPPDR